MQTVKSYLGLGASTAAEPKALSGWDAVVAAAAEVDPESQTVRPKPVSQHTDDGEGSEPNSTESEPLYARYLPSLPQLPEFSYAQRLVGALISLAAGIIMMVICFTTLHLLLLGGAAKFALSYVMANIFILTSTCFIVPPSRQLPTLFSRERYIITSAYFGSMILTLFVCFTKPTMFIVLPCLAVQFATLVWYVYSYTPCAGRSSSGGSGLTEMPMRFISSFAIQSVFTRG